MQNAVTHNLSVSALEDEIESSLTILEFVRNSSLTIMKDSADLTNQTFQARVSARNTLRLLTLLTNQTHQLIQVGITFYLLLAY